jgi:actin-related protein
MNDQMSTDQKPNYILGSKLYHPTPNLEIISPFEDGLVSNWDAFEQLWDYSYKKALHVVSKEHPIMFCDPCWDTKENREKLCELAFEKFDAPGFYLGRSAVLSAFAAGRATALVIDSGESGASVVPVYDGYIVKKAIQRAPIGGSFVSHQVRQYLKHHNIDITPSSLVESKTAVESTQPPQFVRKNVNGLTESWNEFSTEVFFLFM